MKKVLSVVLAVAMLLVLTAPTIAVNASTGPNTATLEGVGFHCNHGGNGNGKTDVYYSTTGPKARSEIFDAKGKVLKGVAADTGTKFKFDFVRIDETTWKLVSENYYCVECNNNIWASYSNKSGVPNGKNIQVNPYTPPTPPPPPDVYGTLSIQKMVGEQTLTVWANENGYVIDEIIAGMEFTAYLLDGENGNRVVPEQAFPGEISSLNGIIDFGSSLPIGWYEVVEEVSGTAVNYFVGETKTQVYYVGATGVSGEVENFVSGQDNIGTIVSHDGAGVNWKLPDVWDGRLGNDPTYQKLMNMGAKWIWDGQNANDVYSTGITGDAITLEFEVTLGEAITVPLYFAADNVALIYVNGKLAAFTDVALAGRGVAIGDAYDSSVLGTLKFDKFDGRWNEGWANAYEKEIRLEAGVNEIIIIAANSASTGYIDDNGNFVNGSTGTDNDGYNYTNNPCGLIFGFEIPATTFDNEPKVIEYSNEYIFTPMVSKTVENKYYTGEWFWDNAWENKFIAYDSGAVVKNNNSYTIEYTETAPIDAEAIWNTDIVRHMESGLVEFEFDYTIDGTIIGGTDFTVAADNGFVMFVNGTLVANSLGFVYDERFDTVDGLLTPESLALYLSMEDICIREDLFSPDTYAWRTDFLISWETIAPLLNGNGATNTIKIIAYNVSETCELGLDCAKEAGYAPENSWACNAACILFSGTVVSEIETIIS